MGALLIVVMFAGYFAAGVLASIALVAVGIELDTIRRRRVWARQRRGPLGSQLTPLDLQAAEYIPELRR